VRGAMSVYEIEAREVVPAGCCRVGGAVKAGLLGPPGGGALTVPGV
jgi:hypothetical protein